LMNAIWRFFLSLKTAFGLFFVFIVLAFIGSIMLPHNLAFFSGIDDTPLFRWLAENDRLVKTWWIYAMIVMLAMLAVSTIFCTIEALMKRMSRKNFILKISPQVMHIGVLFIMLGHLLTASFGLKLDLVLNRGEKKEVMEGKALLLQDVSVTTDENGYDIDWQARLSWFEDGRVYRDVILRPVHPLYFGQTGLYIKAVTMEPDKSALIRVCRDPGALWALVGGVLLTLGGLGFIYGRFSS